MKTGSTEKRGMIRSGLDGFRHLMAFTNLYTGENSLGDKIMDTSMYRDGPVDNPLMFGIGFFAGAALELGAFSYSLYEAFNSHPEYLIADVALKTVPRSIELVFFKNR